jgi:hypothetical protein
MKTNEEVMDEYFKLMDKTVNDKVVREAFLKILEDIRKKEPRINSGVHLYDYLMMWRGDDMESYYGPDYFSIPT